MIFAHLCSHLPQVEILLPYPDEKCVNNPVLLPRLSCQQVEDRHPVDAAGRTPLDKAREAFQQDVFGEEVLQQLEQLWQA